MTVAKPWGWAVIVVAWVATLAMVSGPAAGGAARRGPGSVVVDATGRELGWIAEVADPAEGQQAVLVRAGGVAVLVVASGARVVKGTSSVVFEDGACQGPPLVTVPDSPPGFRPLFRPSGIGPPGALLVGEGAVASRIINSEWNTLAVPATCDPVAAVAQDIQPGTFLLDLSTFVSPLVVR